MARIPRRTLEARLAAVEHRLDWFEQRFHLYQQRVDCQGRHIHRLEGGVIDPMVMDLPMGMAARLLFEGGEDDGP